MTRRSGRIASFALALLLCASVVTTAVLPARAGENAAVAAKTAPYATLLRTMNPHLALAQSAAYAEALLNAAKRFDLNPDLIVALVMVESSWRPDVTSIHGARGLGQLKPGTAQELGVDAWSGRQNLSGTAHYLRELLGTFHGGRDPVREALAGYNAGPGAVLAAGGRAPNYESRHYVVKVMHALAVVRSRVAHLLPTSLDQRLADDAAAGDGPTAADLDDALRSVDAAQASYWGADEGATASP